MSVYTDPQVDAWKKLARALRDEGVLEFELPGELRMVLAPPEPPVMTTEQLEKLAGGFSDPLALDLSSQAKEAERAAREQAESKQAEKDLFSDSDMGEDDGFRL